MFNFKISGAAAGAAFVLSLLVGLISGAAASILLLRALLFAALFFLLTCLVFWLLNQFVPEIFSAADDSLDLAPGSRVDISIGPDRIEGAFPAGDHDTVDNIEKKPPASVQNPPGDADSLFSAPKGLDQGEGDGYTTGGDWSAENSAGNQAGFGTDPGEIDLMPDFDSLSAAFLSNQDSPVAGGGEKPAEFEEASAFETPVFDSPESGAPEPRRPLSSSKNSSLKGDFNPKELAQAIQTVLKKEEKG